MATVKSEMAGTLKFVLWGAVAVVCVALITSAMQRKRDAAVNDVVVDIAPLEDGHHLINEADVLKLLEERFAPPVQQLPLGQLDMERLERVLEEVPFVLSAEAYIDANNRIHIDLEQREPLLRVMDNNGLNYYLDKQGNDFPPSLHYAARVRVANGHLPPYELGFLGKSDHLLTQVFLLNARLREDPFLDALIEQIYVNKRGELILSPKIGKQTILFGRYERVEDKLSRLKTFYREGLPYKGWRAYQSFDLRYNGQVVCVKR